MSKSVRSYPRRRLRKRFELALSKLILQFLSFIAGVLPDRWVCTLGQVLGRLFFSLSRGYHRVALNNLRRFYGHELSPDEIHQMALRVFENFGKCLVEFLQLPRMGADKLNQKIHLEGTSYLDEALAKGNGVIIITAHYGNWEYIGAKLVQDGYPVNVIARNADDEGINRMVNEIREGCGYRVFSRDGSMLPVARSLKQNQIIAILPDQHDYRGIFVDFFGYPAKTPSGPAALALMTGAVLVPGFCVREPGDVFTAHFQPGIEVVKTGDKEQDIYNLTCKINKVIEEQIRKAPCQWLWFHNRWKSEPPAESVSEIASQ